MTQRQRHLVTKHIGQARGSGITQGSSAEAKHIGQARGSAITQGSSIILGDQDAAIMEKRYPETTTNQPVIGMTKSGEFTLQNGMVTRSKYSKKLNNQFKTIAWAGPGDFYSSNQHTRGLHGVRRPVSALPRN